MPGIKPGMTRQPSLGVGRSKTAIC